jgi:cyclophilin family peptidyl-prolyl cis-trans isomerase
MRSFLIALALSAAAAVLAVEQYEFTVNIEGAKEAFTIEVHDEWAPLGAARFKELVALDDFFPGVRFFRTIKGFMTQFGISGKPATAAQWKDKKISDDPRKPEISNKRGFLSFATSGKDSRTTQMFINLVDNANLDVRDGGGGGGSGGGGGAPASQRAQAGQRVGWQWRGARQPARTGRAALSQ